MFKDDISNSINCGDSFYEKIPKKLNKKKIPEYRIFGSKEIRRMNTEQLVEHFGLFGIKGASGGNKTKIDSTTEIKKKAELNTNIDRSMVVKSVQDIVNNVNTEVAQKNTANVNQAVGSGNIIGMYGVDCDTMNITDITQSAESSVALANKTIQSQISKVNNNITTTIKKKITNSLPNDAADLKNSDNKLLDNFMKSTPGIDPEKAKKIAGGLSNDGFGNSNTVNVKQSLDQELKKTFDLNESFKIDDKDAITSNVANKVTQSNMASCQSNSSSINKIILADVQCVNLNMSRIKQESVAKAVLNCVFDQKLVSTIANKVTNNIDKQFSRLYKGAGNDKKKIGQIDDLGYAVAENLRNAAGIKGLPFKPSSGSAAGSAAGNAAKPASGGQSDPLVPPTTLPLPVLDQTENSASDSSSPSSPASPKSKIDSTDKESASTEKESDSTQSDSKSESENSNPDDLISLILSLFGAENTTENRTTITIILVILIILIIVLIVSLPNKTEE